VAKAAIQVKGLNNFRLELARIDKKWPKELLKVHKTISREVSVQARLFATGTGPMQHHFAKAITGDATQRVAAVRVAPKANAAFWGAKKRTGWYGRRRYGKSPGRQFPPWVGNSWEPGGAGGPLAINPAIRHDLPKIEKRFNEMVEEVSRRAFPT
jgi:hypothetical protein